MSDQNACSFSFTGGPVTHQALNVCAASVVHELHRNDVRCLGLARGITPILNGFGDQSIKTLTPEMFVNAEELQAVALPTERFLPRRTPFELQSVIRFLRSRKVFWDISTGGDGTFITKLHLSRANRKLRASGYALKRIVQIPRTMDGDFINEKVDIGFATALHHGVKSLIGFAGDCSIYGGPCVTRMMGRNEGLYTLHCASNYGAEMCLVPEEFEAQSVDHLQLIDALVAHVLLSLVENGRYSQILIAEGFWHSLSRQSQDLLGIERCGADEHFRIDFLASPPINATIAEAIESRLHELGVTEYGTPVPVQKRAIGYAERQREAVEADLELAIELGSWASQLALSEDERIPDGVVAMPNREWIAFEDIENDGDQVLSAGIKLSSPLFKRSLSKQRWLRPADLENEQLVGKLSAMTKLSGEQFCKEFGAAAQFFQHRDQ